MRRLNLFDSDCEYLSKGRIEEIFGLLNNELIRKKKNLNIVIYDDTVLCLLTQFKEKIFSIDIISKEGKLLKDCFKDCGVSEYLFNVDSKTHVNPKGLIKIDLEFSNLKVYSPSLEYFIAIKVRKMLEKDEGDVIELINELGLSSVKEISDIFLKYYSRIHLSKYRVEFIKKLLIKKE